MKVLVAYGSKRGGTAGVAEMIGEELESAGMGATVTPARAVKGVDGFDAVVLAGPCTPPGGTATRGASPSSSPRHFGNGRSGW